jgi:hypothetical protein
MMIPGQNRTDTVAIKRHLQTQQQPALTLSLLIRQNHIRHGTPFAGNAHRASARHFAAANERDLS